MANNSKKLKLCHINTRSILAYNNEFKTNQVKMDEIREILCKKFEYDVIAITESWLSPDISVDSTDLHIDNYTFYRKDRFNANNRGGGVGVFVTNNLLCLQRADLATNDIELLWLELHTNSKTVLVGVCYRPPGQSRDEQSNFFSKLETSIENVKLACPDNIVLLGDFNDKCTDWHMPHTQSEVGNKLLNLLLQNNLAQLISEPTRYCNNSTTLLDLLITDCPHMVLNSGVSPPLANLDHCTIYCTLNIDTYRSKSYKRTVWDYKTANIQGLNDALERAPFDLPYTLYENINDIVEFNNSLILSACKEYIINKTVTVRTKDKPWMCNEVRYFFRRRDRCFKRYKRTLSAQDKLYFYIARREANTAKRNAIKRYNEKTINTFNDPNLNAKTFWKLSKRILGDKSDHSIPPLRENNTLVPDDTNKTNIFNDYFASISSLDPYESVPKLPDF
ncbi:MAG: endonuclease/exonuclease/phosphatase family protein, partial [Candidatus Thiodiazotropha endolucinida]